MPVLLQLLAPNPTSTTIAGSASKSSGGSSFQLLFLVAIVFGIYFLFLRPRNRRMRQQQQAKAGQLAVGDEVQSIGGIRGIVVALDDDDVEVQVAPDVVLTFVRRAVNPRPDAASVAPSPAGVDPEVEDEEEWRLPGEGSADAQPSGDVVEGSVVDGAGEVEAGSDNRSDGAVGDRPGLGAPDHPDGGGRADPEGQR
ncbi:MAG: preprotein translocase subunit YajC [Acidimicrobiales bacterium]